MKATRAGPIVEVAGLTKTFGGIRAVNDLSFTLREGQVTGLIGPNGAGKTTVFNLLTGAIKPDAGRVLLQGRDITGRPPHKVARMGMVRSFQDLKIHPRLSVLDSVMMGVQEQPGEHLLVLLARPITVRRSENRTQALAREVLAAVGMHERLEEQVRDLSFGEQKLVALARILATGADVLLLDEPASGVDRSEMTQVIEVIKALQERGLTLCVVEHNLFVVEQLAELVHFMENGEVTATGPMHELKADPRLVEAYFGSVEG